MKNLNQNEINLKIHKYKELNNEIDNNKFQLMQKFNIKNILWQSNWSLNNFNSYLMALKAFNFNNSKQRNINNNGNNLNNLNIILNDTYSGLQKDGFICLNTHQVIQQWIETLEECKNSEYLINEIKLMENSLQNTLFNIKLTQTLSNKTKFQIKSAYDYYHVLNSILNRLTIKYSNFMNEKNNLYNFSNLQLVVDE